MSTQINSQETCNQNMYMAADGEEVRVGNESEKISRGRNWIGWKSDKVQGSILPRRQKVSSFCHRVVYDVCHNKYLTTKNKCL